MVGDKYTAVATKPGEMVVCTVLDAGNYLELYSARVEEILGKIKDDPLKQRAQKTLGSFESIDGKLAQSSPYRLVVLQPLLPKGKVLVSTPRLRIARQNNPDFIRGFFCDSDLNLVTDQKYQVNPVQAEELATDLKKVGLDLKHPKLIPYRILTPRVRKNSPSGLVFRLSKEGMDTAKTAILNTNDFTWDYKPTKSGLFRADVDTDGGYAGDEGLGLSYGHGRVIVETTGEAGSREFEYLNEEATKLLQKQAEERRSLIDNLSR